MLPAINEITSQQAKSTSMTEDKCKMFMYYATTHPSAKIRYHASDMRLHVDSDTVYLVLSKARSRGAGHFYLNSNPTSSNIIPYSRDIGTIIIECVTLKNVMPSAAEAEAGTLYHNGKTAILIRTTLQELGHPQGSTPVKNDNNTVAGFFKSTIRQKTPSPGICNFTE